MKTFKGGIHPDYSKLTAKNKIESMPPPKKVIIPLQQHIGAPALPLVQVGDEVKIGQLIGKIQGNCSANIHSSICGTVTDISMQPHPNGKKSMSITIENNSKQDTVKLKEKEVLKIIEEAGIVGMGGATFPAHVKLNPPKEKPIDTLIINGLECEPYLTCDHRLMLEHSDEIIDGAKIVMHVLKIPNAYFAIEDNKKDAFNLIKSKLPLHIKPSLLKTKYPQGAEKIVIKAILKREVPSGKLPMDVGVVCHNVGTLYAIHSAVRNKLPVTERIVTVTGDVSRPKNILTKIGTPFEDLIKFAGAQQPDKIIAGGPMMGVAQYSDQVPVVKGVCGILIRSKVVEPTRHNCIRCGRCVDACPLGLMPLHIARYSEKRKYDIAEEYNLLDCFECGSCEFQCPSKIPLVQLIKQGKIEVCKYREHPECKI